MENKADVKIELDRLAEEYNLDRVEFAQILENANVASESSSIFNVLSIAAGLIGTVSLIAFIGSSFYNAHSINKIWMGVFF